MEPEPESTRKLNKVIEEEITKPILKLISDFQNVMYPFLDSELHWGVNIFDCKNCEHQKRNEDQYPCKNCYCNPALSLKQYYSEAEEAFD